MTRRARFARAALASSLAIALLLAGCAASDEPTTGPDADASAEAPIAIKIGTLPTEDLLPLWVAQRDGYFDGVGLPAVEIVVFQSAQERDAAFSAGAIDAFMGDIIASANLEAAGSGVTIATVMLGATQAEGRFGVVMAPGGALADPGLVNAAGKPVGTSSATIQEYVLDGLMAEAGVAASDVKVEEVKKVPVRFELLMQGKIEFAALPEPFLSLAEAQGAVLLADDVTAKANLSQTVLGVSDDYLAKPGGTESVDALLAAWDRAVTDINADPASFRPLLVEQARLPKPLETTYKVNTYPMHALPTRAEVDSVTAWMKAKGYLKQDITFEDLTLVLPGE